MRKNETYILKHGGIGQHLHKARGNTSIIGISVTVGHMTLS